MASVESARVRYAIDPAISRFIVRASATGLLSAFGHDPTIAIRDFAGEIEATETSLETASLTLRVRADRLAVQDNAINDKDRREIERVMKEEVIETARFPEIHFTSTRVGLRPVAEGRNTADITGDLTLHGVTRSLTFVVQTSLLGAMLRANGEFTLLQSQYGITLVSVAGGTLKVKDELKVSFDIVARRQA
jgi:polyisoprenoid-binding protein YceI